MQPEVHAYSARRPVIFRGESAAPDSARLWHPAGPEGPVLQPSDTQRHPSFESNPLLNFFSEHASAREPDAPSGPAIPEKPQQSAQPVGPVQKAEPFAPSDDVAADLLHRLERIERLLDRSVIEIAALTSDLATLVTTVEDIRKRQALRETPVPAPPPHPNSRIPVVPATIAAVVLAAVAASIWGLISFAAYAAPEPPAIQTQPVEPVSVLPPFVGPAVPPPFVGPSVPPEVNAEAVSARAPARAAPRVAPPTPAAPRVVSYVGTLTIDSSPAGEVFLNRSAVGRTPLRLEGLRAGSHLIWIQSEGFRRWTRVVPVAADRISRVSATLDPLDR